MNESEPKSSAKRKSDQRKALNKAKRAYHEMGYLSAEEVDGADEAMDDDDA